MKHRIRSVAIVAIFLAFALISFSVSAHNTSQDGILTQTYIEELEYNGIGGEEIGWIIDEHEHIGTTSIQYRFIDFEESSYYYVPEHFRPIFMDAMSMWSEVVTMTESDTATGLFHCYSATEDGLDAILIAGTYNGPEHYEEWSMYVNNLTTPAAATIAHELGHLIGLRDLYTDRNQNKLMYYHFDSTAEEPAEVELWGARVILGLHTSHTFTDCVYQGSDSNAIHYHAAYCADCGGKRVGLVRCLPPPRQTVGPCIGCGHLVSSDL